MKCKNCQSVNFYTLKNDYIKCKKCGKKYSQKKIETNKKIIEGFINNSSAYELSKNLKLNYITVKNKYDMYRITLCSFLENEYYTMPKDYSEYEEFYYYNEKQKLQTKKSLYSAINIIGFYSNQKVYTLLMPNLKYRKETLSEGYEKYLHWHKIYSKNSYKTKLYDFWKFLEDNLLKYKGIKKENFIYYLKECEFKFNYTKKEQFEILETF